MNVSEAAEGVFASVMFANATVANILIYDKQTTDFSSLRQMFSYECEFGSDLLRTWT